MARIQAYELHQLGSSRHKRVLHTWWLAWSSVGMAVQMAVDKRVPREWTQTRTGMLVQVRRLFFIKITVVVPSPAGFYACTVQQRLDCRGTVSA